MSTKSSRAQRSDWAGKPPRLRSACTECHDAKTRCSGETTGCQRCQSNGLFCKYGVSMVGRASKRGASHSNARCARRQSSSYGPETQTSIPSPGTSGSGFSASSGQAHTGAGSDASRPHVLGPSAPRHADGGEAPEDLSHDPLSSAALFDVPHSFEPGLDASSTSLMSFRIEDLVFPHDEDSGSNTACSSTAVATPGPSRLFNHVPTARLDRLHPERGTQDLISDVTAICKIIEVLETRIQTQKNAIDDLLRVNKECVATMVRIVDSNNYTRCKSCLPLLSTALELVVTLYEEAAEVLKHSTASDASGIPDVLIGVFHIDPEDQLVIFTSVVAKEVRKCQHLLETIQRLSPLSLEGSDAAPSHSLALSFEEVASRINSVLSRLETERPH